MRADGFGLYYLGGEGGFSSTGVSTAVEVSYKLSPILMPDVVRNCFVIDQ